MLSVPGEPLVELSPPGAKRPLRIVAEGDVSRGVRDVTLNGRPVESRILRHAEIRDGGDLAFVGGLQPPPSAMGDGLSSRP